MSDNGERHLVVDFTYPWYDPELDGADGELAVVADYSWGPLTHEIVEPVAAFDRFGVDRLEDLPLHVYEDVRAQARSLAHEQLEHEAGDGIGS